VDYQFYYAWDKDYFDGLASRELQKVSEFWLALKQLLLCNIILLLN